MTPDADPHRHDPPHETGPTAPLEHWEERYTTSGSMWSGEVNATLAEALADLAPARAIDLGCGEGADVLWLAEHGWDALGLDLSPTAIDRARAEATARALDGEPGAGTAGRARFEACDLTRWTPSPGSVELVTASFFHSRVELERTAILRRAATAVGPGGHLVVLSHAAPPPWAHGDHHDMEMLSAQQEAQQLDLPAQDWTVATAAQIERGTTDPDGGPSHLEDSLLILRRR